MYQSLNIVSHYLTSFLKARAFSSSSASMSKRCRSDVEIAQSISRFSLRTLLAETVGETAAACFIIFFLALRTFLSTRLA